VPGLTPNSLTSRPLCYHSRIEAPGWGPSSLVLQLRITVITSRWILGVATFAG
jgi:hypothetical protein